MVPANVAQLVERNLAKVEVASSNLVVRSMKKSPGPYGPGLFSFYGFRFSGFSGFYDQLWPVSSSYASMYLARVAATTSSGRAGGGVSLLRSQPEAGEVSQSRTNCLS